MKYVLDNDLHIHSRLSLCSGDPEQTAENILAYAKRNSLKTVCLTDHYWDENIPGAPGWYAAQNYAHVAEALPLPQDDGVEFLFGCETEMDKNFEIKISDKMFDKFDFIIVPTTHLHMTGLTIDECDGSAERRAELYVKRFEGLLASDMPFGKVGVAHLTCGLILPPRNGEHHKVLDLVPDGTFRELFERSAKLGLGIELNFPSFDFSGQALEDELRPYRIAAEAGCRFYFGSDAHHPGDLAAAPANFAHIVELLGLREDQKFTIGNI